MKWLLRLVRPAKKRTPLPPKPYVDMASAGKHMVDAKLYDPNDLSHIDPEKQHWQDPRFDSRSSVPFFDLFGFNRDWSWSLFKFSSLFFVLVMYMEMRSMVMYGDQDYRVTSSNSISAVPEYARDEKATEEELKAAGFSYVGVQNLDHLTAATASENSQKKEKDAIKRN